MKTCQRFEHIQAGFEQDIRRLSVRWPGLVRATTPH